MKNKYVLKLLFIILSIFMTACIHDMTEDVRPQKITVSGTVMIDEDGIGVGQPAKPVTDVEDFFVLYADGIAEQSITSDISDIDIVETYDAASYSKLPVGMQVYTNDDSEATYSEDGEFLIEISADASTIWAGIPGEGYDVAFVDVQGDLVVGEILSQLDGEDIEIVLTPRDSGKITFWLGPDDTSTGGTKVADAGSELYIKGPAVGGWSPAQQLTGSSTHSGYYYFEATNTPGEYQYGYMIGSDSGGEAWTVPLRADGYTVAEFGTNATALFIGESTGEKYTPSVNNPELTVYSIAEKDSNADYINAAETFKFEVSVEAKYIDSSSPIKTVTADLSELGISGTTTLTNTSGSTFGSGDLSFPSSLTSGTYGISVTAKAEDGTDSTVVSELTFNTETDSTSTDNLTVNVESLSFYLVGDIIAETDGVSSAWGAGSSENEMTSEGSGVYSKTVNISTAGTLSFQITTDDWGTKYTGAAQVEVGTQGTLEAAGLSNENINITSAGNYKVSVDLTNMTIDVTSLNFYLVGNIIAETTGVSNAWGAGSSENQLTSLGDDVYEKVVNITTPGTLNFQITTADWGTKYTGAAQVEVGTQGTLEAAGMSNQNINITTAGNYKVKVDLANMTIDVETVDYYLVGAVIAETTGVSSAWGAGSSENAFTYLGDDIYEKEINITTAETKEFQITTGDWATKYTGTAQVELGTQGSLEAAGMSNQSINFTSTGDYKITIDLGDLTIDVASN